MWRATEGILPVGRVVPSRRLKLPRFGARNRYPHHPHRHRSGGSTFGLKTVAPQCGFPTTAILPLPQMIRHLSEDIVLYLDDFLGEADRQQLMLSHRLFYSVLGGRRMRLVLSGEAIVYKVLQIRDRIRDIDIVEADHVGLCSLALLCPSPLLYRFRMVSGQTPYGVLFEHSCHFLALQRMLQGAPHLHDMTLEIGITKDRNSLVGALNNFFALSLGTVSRLELLLQIPISLYRKLSFAPGCLSHLRRLHMGFFFHDGAFPPRPTPPALVNIGNCVGTLCRRSTSLEQLVIEYDWFPLPLVAALQILDSILDEGPQSLSLLSVQFVIVPSHSDWVSHEMMKRTACKLQNIQALTLSMPGVETEFVDVLLANLPPLLRRLCLRLDREGLHEPLYLPITIQQQTVHCPELEELAIYSIYRESQSLLRAFCGTPFMHLQCFKYTSHGCLGTSVPVLMELLSRMPRLRTLHLSLVSENLMEEDCIRLAVILEDLAELRCITLNLADNNICANGYNALLLTLSGNAHRPLQSIDLYAQGNTLTGLITLSPAPYVRQCRIYLWQSGLGFHSSQVRTMLTHNHWEIAHSFHGLQHTTHAWTIHL